MKSYILAATLLLACACAIGAEPEDVSLIQLIARPQDYDGKFVRLIGFVNLQFEGNVICLHEEDCRRRLMRNCLWLDATDEVLRKRSEYHQKYVLVEGFFNANKHGHLGAYQGTIERLSRWYIWGSPGHEHAVLYTVSAAALLLLGLCIGYVLRRRKRRPHAG
jgi:hypothetical protein